MARSKGIAPSALADDDSECAPLSLAPIMDFSPSSSPPLSAPHPIGRGGGGPPPPYRSTQRGRGGAVVDDVSGPRVCPIHHLYARVRPEPGLLTHHLGPTRAAVYR